jgi:hypothetical protein
MMKCFILLLTAVFTLNPIQAQANIPPAGDVSCQLSDTGVRYGVSITFSGGAISFNSLSYEWEYSILNAGSNPALTSSYGAKAPAVTSRGNGLDLTYEQLLSYSKNDPNAVILMNVITVFSDGISTFRNANGKACYVELPVVLNNKNQKAASKSAEDRAIEEAKRTGSNPATNSAIVNQVNSEREALRSEIALKIKQNPSLTKMLLPFNSQLTAAESPTDLDAQTKLKILSSIRSNLAGTLKKFGSTSLTCVKGKLKKTVTGQNPKCPSGYKPVASK